MNTLELIDVLKKECGISRKEAAAVVDLFFESMSETLAKGDRVEIRGLCSFFVKEYKSYQGRNPKTGCKSYPLTNSHRRLIVSSSLANDE